MAEKRYIANSSNKIISNMNNKDVELTIGQQEALLQSNPPYHRRKLVNTCNWPPFKTTLAAGK
jgi:hypothetical protein